MKTFKPSGVDWLGDIPAHWQIKKLKYFASRPTSFIKDGDWIESDFITESGIRYLTTGNIGDGFFKEQGDGHISIETFHELKCMMITAGDLVFSRLNLPMGRACIIPDKYSQAVIAVDNVLLRPDNDVSQKYVMYVTMCTGYQKTNEFFARGTTMRRMSCRQLKNVKFPCPPLDEQEKIAAYLDKACGALDREIEIQRALIDKLRVYKKSLIYEVVTGGLNPDVPKKFSGVEWLGDIPAHWQVIKLKFAAKNFVDKKPYVGGVYVGMEHVESWTGKISYPEGDIEVDSVLNSFDERTILFGKLRPYLAKVARPDRVGQCSTEFLTLLPRDGVDKNFLFHTLSAKGFIDVVNSSTYGVKMPRASWQFIGNMRIPCPPLDEQKTIAAYLDRKCRLLDENISERTALVGRLSAYKKSLIYEVVTGKTEVGR